MAAIKAFQKEFIRIETKGCFFHYCQAIFRKVCDLRLRKEYYVNERFRNWVKMLMGLALIPHWELETAFEILTDRLYDVNLGG